LCRFLFTKNQILVMNKVSYYTEEGLNRMKDELHEMKTKGRALASADIAEARDKGDLSENAEYDAAKDAQGLLEMRIAKLETVLANARVIREEDVDTSKVGLLTKVKIKNLKNGMEVTYTMVSEEEANLKEGRVSIKSPIGMGLMGKKVGEKAQVEAPVGKMEFEVLNISL
jgi:transcription elongation factor GreA